MPKEIVYLFKIIEKTMEQVKGFSVKQKMAYYLERFLITAFYLAVLYVVFNIVFHNVEITLKF